MLTDPPTNEQAKLARVGKKNLDHSKIEVGRASSTYHIDLHQQDPEIISFPQLLESVMDVGRV